MEFKMKVIVALVTILIPLTTNAVDVPPSAVLNQAKEVKDSIAIVGLGGDFVVTGVTKYHSHFLAANTIVFESGSQLILLYSYWKQE